MSDAPRPNPLWIKGPWTDLFFFSFGWILAFAAFVTVDYTALPENSRTLLVIAILLFNFLHRHLTFPLVYADPEQFRERRIAYIALPLFFLALTLTAFFYARVPNVRTEPLRGAILSRPATQHFIFSTADHVPGKPYTRVQVRFRGTEKTPDELAAALHTGLKGWLAVEALDDRLIFRLAGPKPGLQFTVRSSWGDRDLAPRLGLIKGRWYGFPLNRPLFTMMVILAVIWTIYHSIMQKVGLLRIYSRKAGAGRSWIDKSMILSWFVFLLFHLGSMPEVRTQAADASMVGEFAGGLLEWATAVLPVLVWVSLAAAAALTILYFFLELRGTGRFSWPRNLYVASILMLYATFYYDMVTGYAVFAFSHAIEYIAFVNVYSRKKYLARPDDSSLLARAVRRQVVSMIAYCLILVPAFLLMRWGAPTVLSWYIVGSGFLHFIYDGWIWKVRKPAVGSPLGLRYGQGAPAPG